MRLLVDDRPCETSATSVGEAIAGAAEVAGARGRVVVEVVVDGRTWGDEELGSEARCGASADEVSLVTADLRELAGQTLEDAAAALADADRLQRESARLIQSDRLPEAMPQLGEALSVWQSVQEALVKSTQAVGLDLDAVRLGEGTVADDLERLAGDLRTLRRALETRDPVGLADTLLYDLPEVVLQWQENLRSLAAVARKGGNAPEQTS